MMKGKVPQWRGWRYTCGLDGGRMMLRPSPWVVFGCGRTSVAFRWLLLVLLALGMDSPLQGQERNPGGRRGNAGELNTQRAPEGTRERPIQQTPIKSASTVDQHGTKEVFPLVTVCPSHAPAAVCGGVVLSGEPAQFTFTEVVLEDCRWSPKHSGYSFAGRRIVSYTHDSVDVFFENRSGDYSMVVRDDTDIQDLGMTASLEELPMAPRYGWSETGKATLWERHTYAVRTWDNTYVKFRVETVDRRQVVFRWTLQEEPESRADFTRTVGVKVRPEVRAVFTR